MQAGSHMLVNKARDRDRSATANRTRCSIYKLESRDRKRSQQAANRINEGHSQPGKQRQRKVSKQQTEQIRDCTHTLASRGRERSTGSKQNKQEEHSHPGK